MTEPVLLTEIHPAGYAVLTLNRPQAMNALSRQLMTDPDRCGPRFLRRDGPEGNRLWPGHAGPGRQRRAAAWGFVNRMVPADTLLDAARAMALDMTGALPELLAHYKAVIRDGFALPFGEAMVMEKQRGRAFNARLAAADIEGRRESVRQRNRQS